LTGGKHPTYLIPVAVEWTEIIRCVFAFVLVARRKSLFDDKADEIQQLTLVIKQDLGTLNRQIAQLQEVKSFPCSYAVTRF